MRYSPDAHSTPCIRARLKKQRSALSRAEQQRASTTICRTLLNLDIYQTSKYIGAYLALGREINLSQFIEQAIADGKTIALPRIDQTTMVFKAYDRKRVAKNQFNITEPLASCKTISTHELDWVLVPLVGFDSAGNRIGMGGGFYDRHFDGIAHLNSPFRSGIAYDFQQIDCIQTQPWDVPMHQIVTESRLITPR